MKQREEGRGRRKELVRAREKEIVKKEKDERSGYWVKHILSEDQRKGKEKWKKMKMFVS